MKRCFEMILRFRKGIILLYVILTALAALASTRVNVDSNLANYLPVDSDSTVALDIMETEYGGDIPNAQLMVRDISLEEAERLEEQLLNIDGVEAVTWASDSNLLGFPLELMDEETLERYYHNGNALYTLTLDGDAGIELTEEIRAAAGKETAMSGSFINNKVVAANSSKEIIRVVAVVVVFGLGMLILTLDTWLEPVLLVLCLFAAVILNSGTNLALGTISSVTKTAASVLQMGVSVDYFIFILHRYKECRSEHMSPESAMAEAMSRSMVSVLSSSLTTMIGFVALTFMRYRIGLDMGIVLSKGVAISLICAFTLMPCVILSFDKAIQRTTHDVVFHSVGRLPELAMKVTGPALVLFLCLALPSSYLQQQNLFYYGSSHSYKDTHWVMQERQEIQETFGKSNSMVLMVPKGETGRENQLRKAVEELPGLNSITSFTSTLDIMIPVDAVPDSLRTQLISDNYSRLVLDFALDEESDETFALIDSIKAIAAKYYGDEYQLVGNSVSTYDLKQVISADTIKVNLIAVGAIFLVLMLSFRRIVIPILLTLGIEGAIWINMTIPYFMGSHLFYIGYLIVSAILLGATVDYAILTTSRCLELKAQGCSFREAITGSMRLSSISIFTSSSILAVAGILLLLLCTNQLIAQLGLLLARGVLLAVIIVQFVLPGMLAVEHKLRAK